MSNKLFWAREEKFLECQNLIKENILTWIYCIYTCVHVSWFRAKLHVFLLVLLVIISTNVHLMDVFLLSSQAESIESETLSSQKKLWGRESERIYRSLSPRKKPFYRINISIFSLRTRCCFFLIFSCVLMEVIYHHISLTSHFNMNKSKVIE